MVGSSGSSLDTSISKFGHVKVQALITDDLISKKWGGFNSFHLKYDLPQDNGDVSNPITFQQYLANMNAKTGKCAGDQLFHKISCDNNPTTIHFMYFTLHKL